MKFAYFIYINVSKLMSFIDVINFTINGFKLYIYSLKMALSCRNMPQ